MIEFYLPRMNRVFFTRKTFAQLRSELVFRRWELLYLIGVAGRFVREIVYVVEVLGAEVQCTRIRQLTPECRSTPRQEDTRGFPGADIFFFLLAILEHLRCTLTRKM